MVIQLSDRVELLRNLLAYPKAVKDSNLGEARLRWEGLRHLDDDELMAYLDRHFHDPPQRGRRS